MIRRHPIRGLIGGLLIGLGLSILLVIYGAAPLGSWTVIVLILLFAVIGTAAAWLLPARSRPAVVARSSTTVDVDRDRV